MEENNLNIAVRNKEKFEFYFLALTFTILGLSIQTAEYTTYCYQTIIELSAWFALLLSGLAGLSRQEYLPVAYFAEHRRQITEEYRQNYEQRVRGQRGILHPEDGRKLNREEIQIKLDSLDARLDAINKEKKRIERGVEAKYSIHKYTFVTGIILLIASRSLVALSKMN